MLSILTDERPWDDWRKRALDSFYPILFLDTLLINVKDNSKVIKKLIYLELAVPSGRAKRASWAYGQTRAEGQNSGSRY